ncbi:carboxymuconolactone decarboxylase family protein [Gordonia humi]|uniref:Alkylhydroperoxidase/carboxymuconolactone decarboxylase family protein YurZ n=1 Tax=Gordonia humi TaxID=686429 RepID=A0A840F0W0_9ACTN|nr:carboxymuconolactone decarboxylase family protein [Gordonia humi]MBB4137502.1 alkylhydroperoxidase/carboxymuconolactone decarboxylase family protein YurZ [Gordonia humi]
MSDDAESTSGWTGGRNAFGDFAPGMVHYTDKVLFDEVWERDGLSKRDRSLVTISALTALGKMDQLRSRMYSRVAGSVVGTSPQVSPVAASQAVVPAPRSPGDPRDEQG